MNLMNQQKVSKWYIGVWGRRYTQVRSVSQATEGSDLQLRHAASPLHMVQAAALGPARGALDLNGCSIFTSLKSIILEQKNFHSFWCWTPPVKWPHQLQPLSCWRLWINLSRKKESNPQIMCLSGFNKCQSISAHDAKSPKKEAKLRDHSQPHTAGEMAVWGFWPFL